MADAAAPVKKRMKFAFYARLLAVVDGLALPAVAAWQFIITGVGGDTNVLALAPYCFSIGFLVVRAAPLLLAAAHPEGRCAGGGRTACEGGRRRLLPPQRLWGRRRLPPPAQPPQPPPQQPPHRLWGR